MNKDSTDSRFISLVLNNSIFRMVGMALIVLVLIGTDCASVGTLERKSGSENTHANIRKNCSLIRFFGFFGFFKEMV
ncbi:MAG: hypothetical protein OES09_10055 [Gammaproteobacteria bacterium]|nr:hypothetical protein [Gammaproteobacteria bacterium]